MKKFKDKTVVIEKTFDSHDWACFHDAILDATDKSYTQKELEKLFEELPENIKMTAIQWGMSDTVFGDDVYVHFSPKGVSVEASKKDENGRTPKLIITTGYKGIGRSI